MIARTILAVILSAIAVRAQPQIPSPAVDVRTVPDQEKADPQAFVTATLMRLANEDRKAADSGDAHAQSTLAFRYSQGLGVKQNYAEAARWYRKAAEQGDADAQTNLGFMYGAGQGVTKDYVEAARWYRKAAEQGDVDAELKLGIMYGTGQGVAQDYAEEIHWCRKAADQGSPRAQYVLGLLYVQGQGSPQDYVAAHMWLNLAASHAAAADQKEYMEVRDSVARKMTPQQIADAQRMTREWKPSTGK